MRDGPALHPDKTRLVDTNREGFDFLGYHIERGKHWPCDKSLMKFKDVIRAKTPRCHGQSLSVIIASINRTTRGWFEYFKHTSYAVNVFRQRDGMIRRRLRCILLKRHRKFHYTGRGLAHYRWPNDYFAKHGLFSMETAYVRLRQSVAR